MKNYQLIYPSLTCQSQSYLGGHCMLPHNFCHSQRRFQFFIFGRPWSFSASRSHSIWLPPAQHCLHPAYTGQKPGHRVQKGSSRIEGIFPAGTVMEDTRPQEARFKQRSLRAWPPAVRLLWFGTANTIQPDWGRAGLRKCLSRRLSGPVGNRSRSELGKECPELIS